LIGRTGAQPGRATREPGGGIVISYVRR